MFSPIESSKKFIEEAFPHCSAAFLAGSSIRGEANEYSDLDMVIIDDSISVPYRKIFSAYPYPIEVFVFSRLTYQDFFLENYKKAIPTLHRLCSRAVIIKDQGQAVKIQNEASNLLQKGPQPWLLDDMNLARFEITDNLRDLMGSDDYVENIMTMTKLAERIPHFILRVNEMWVGEGKWLLRELKAFDERFYDEWVEGIMAFYQKNDKRKVIRLVDKVLEPYGGRLFEGFSQSSVLKKKKNRG